jgi:integrase
MMEGQMVVRKRIWKTARGEQGEAWLVDYYHAGKRHFETFERKKDADARHAEIKVEAGKGVHVATSSSTTVRQAADLWLAAAEARVERATLVDYSGHVNRFICPHVGSARLSKFSIASARALEDTLAKEHSPAMVKKVMTTFGTLIADAVERGLVARNVVQEMARSRKGKRTSERRRNGKLKVGVDIPTPEEVGAIINNAGPRWRPLFAVAAFTGLRASELRGLRWVDVDLEKNELHVRQRADRFKKMGPPKSHAGERTVPFGKFVANILREWKLACPKGDLGLVFPNGAGKVEYLANITARGLIPAQGENAKYTGMHCLRHFYASWCIDRNLPPKVIQERMGHSSITITFDRYGHLFPRKDDSQEIDAAELKVVGAS